jgi:hypothetical protein
MIASRSSIRLTVEVTMRLDELEWAYHSEYWEQADCGHIHIYLRIGGSAGVVGHTEIGEYLIYPPGVNNVREAYPGLDPIMAQCVLFDLLERYPPK